MSDEKNITGEQSKEHPDSNRDTNSKKEGSKNIPLPASQTSNLSAEDLSKADIEPQTTNMEVHKHPHHVTHKKKWGEYFLEFLMVFLAVFLGIIAENIREHAVEHEREKQYARQMLADCILIPCFLQNALQR